MALGWLTTLCSRRGQRKRPRHLNSQEAGAEDDREGEGVRPLAEAEGDREGEGVRPLARLILRGAAWTRRPRGAMVVEMGEAMVEMSWAGLRQVLETAWWG